MTITLDLHPDIAQGLLNQARAHGISLIDYLQEIVSRQVRNADFEQKLTGQSLRLPTRSLGDLGSLHRRDIYDDAR